MSCPYYNEDCPKCNKKPMAMTHLEQFNEEVVKEFKEKFYGGQMEHAHYISYFITQKLTEHKALILKMVREKMPDEEYCSSQNSTPIAYGYNSYRQEFLNNLDTI